MKSQKTSGMKTLRLFTYTLWMSFHLLSAEIASPPAEPVIYQLRPAGCDWYSPGLLTKSISEDKVTPIIGALRADAEKKLRSVIVSNLLATLKTPSLTAIAGDAETPDRFVAEGTLDNTPVVIAIGELDLVINVLPRVPEAVTADNAHVLYNNWMRRLFKSRPNEQTISVAVTEEPQYWLVKPLLIEKDGTRRNIPWTWTESATMAVDKAGRWLCLSTKNLPEQVSSMPAGGRGRAHGRWFESDPRAEDTLKKIPRNLAKE